MNNFHTSVLLKESIDLLQVKKGKKYIDATLGGGGHAKEILRRGGIVLGIDWDEEAIGYVKEILRNEDIKILSEEKNKTFNISVSQYPNITLIRGNFRDIDKIAHSQNFDKVAGIIFDLGVSSHQIESIDRGFSFLKEAPLDMRMDPSASSGQVRAADIVNLASKDELYEIFTKLGEESHARAISDAIVRARRIKALLTTGELARIIEKEYHLGKNVPDFIKAEADKRVFQALRIAVNNELENLKEAMPKAIELLALGGRLVVISFHSLEERIVKLAFLDFKKRGIGEIITKKPLIPGLAELKVNRRARSAKLRAFEKNT